MESAFFGSHQLYLLFPVEYVYADWFGWQANIEAHREDPECIASTPEAGTKEAGRRVEGFCIPQFVLRKNDVDHRMPLITQGYARKLES